MSRTFRIVAGLALSVSLLSGCGDDKPERDNGTNQQCEKKQGGDGGKNCKKKGNS